MSTQRDSTQTWAQTVIWLALFVAMIAAGYLGFRTFDGLPDMGSVNLYLLAVVAGVASFFSPCAFPLLPGYFSFYHSASQQKEDQAESNNAVRMGLAAALGVVSFNLVLGAAIALLGAGIGKGLSISGPEPSVLVQIFRAVVGFVLIVLGIGQLRNWYFKPKLADVFVWRTRPEQDGQRGVARNLFYYGLGYNAAGMGCTGPILAGLIVFALSSGGFASAFTAFIVFSLTMGLLMIMISALVAASRDVLLKQMKAATSRIKQISGIILLLVGGFNLFSSINLDWFLRTLFP